MNHRSRLARLEAALPLPPDVEHLLAVVARDERWSTQTVDEVRAELRAMTRRFHGVAVPDIAEVLAQEIGCSAGELLEDGAALAVRSAA